MGLAEATAWLLQARGTDGGWGYFPGEPWRSEPTVLAVAAGGPAPAALLEDEQLDWPALLLPAALSLTAGSEALAARWVERLLARSGSVPEQTGPQANVLDLSLVGWSWYPGTFSWVEPTCFALISLDRSGRSDHPRAETGRRLLLDRVCADGGWNYGNKKVYEAELPSYPQTTGWVLLALPVGHPAAAPALARLRQQLAVPSTRLVALATLGALRHGADPEPFASLLRARQAPDGSFGEGRVDATALGALALAGLELGITSLTGPLRPAEDADG